MRFACLGSGSRGNATLIEANGTRVLVDCGFSLKETRKRLATLKLELSDIRAVLVTHEHGDHLRGVAGLAGAGIPVWATRGTARHIDIKSELHCFNPHEGFEIDALQVQPFPVPHDAREPSQFVFSDGEFRFGMLTDTGHITPHIIDRLTGCDAVLLECNHDSDMLMKGPYSHSLKQRVGGDFGHLSNAQAAELLGQLDCSDLQHVVAAHISEKNNHIELAREALSEALDCVPEWVGVASQEKVLDWRELIHH